MQKIRMLKWLNLFVFAAGFAHAQLKPSLPSNGVKDLSRPEVLIELPKEGDIAFAAYEYGLSCFDTITIYAGFDVFPNQTTAKAMRLGLLKNPQKILNSFYALCGFNPNIPSDPNMILLANDLKMLETYDLSPALNAIHFIAYHGEHDAIIRTPLKGAKIIANTGHLCNLI